MPVEIIITGENAGHALHELRAFASPLVTPVSAQAPYSGPVSNARLAMAERDLKRLRDLKTTQETTFEDAPEAENEVDEVEEYTPSIHDIAAAASAVAEAADDKPKRTRRTKAQIEADEKAAKEEADRALEALEAKARADAALRAAEAAAAYGGVEPEAEAEEEVQSEDDASEQVSDEFPFVAFNADGEELDKYADPEGWLTHVAGVLHEITNVDNVKKLSDANKETVIKVKAVAPGVIDALAEQFKAHAAKLRAKASPASEEAPATGKELTMEDVRDAFISYASSHGKDKAYALVSEYGAVKFSEVPQDKWAELLDRMKGG